MGKSLTNNFLSALSLELSMLLQAGITVHNGVAMMLDDEQDPDGKKVFQSLLDKLEGAVPLSEAMHGVRCFPAYMVNMIEIGERAGRLSETLKGLSEHYERQERLAISIKNATLYPAVLLGLMVAVVLVLIVQVLPIFDDVFARMGAEMTTFAVTLMRFGNWFRGAALVIAIIFLAIFLVAFLIWAVPGVRAAASKFFRDKFGGSGVFGRAAACQFVSAMSLCLFSGLSIEDATDMAASINSDSKALNSKYKKLKTLLENDSNLANALRDSELMTARDSRMLSLGEQSGMADNAMAEIARRNDLTVQDEISAIVGRIEPTLVILTSVIVGVILLSVMLPLVNIMNTIG
ncbi:MAG: type II secretion system F family protein [Defluviitaleaceae bacterium]|nr:type II secretion system F family protein [Defluviitaleaceae bacterium]